VVFLSLHPPAIAPVLSDVKGVLRSDALLVSLAPKWTIAKLSEALGGFAKIVRMIPNVLKALFGFLFLYVSLKYILLYFGIHI
jgi:pyrroline-5-carboxylate reductase